MRPSQIAALPFLLSLVALTFLLPCEHCRADERLKDLACRSVHFAYPGADANLFYNQVTVQQSVPGTYFCVIGWNKGYFGIQQLGDDRRVALFSVWDSGDNDPDALPAEQRTQVLYVDPQVTVKRFGGEGSGGQSFFPFPWKEGQTYHFAVVSWPLGHRTAYAGWLKDLETGKWRHLVTFSTITQSPQATETDQNSTAVSGLPMNGFYSFVEDFRRNGQSARQTRSATYSGMFRRELKSGKVVLQSQARFTGDNNPVMTIDARKTDQGIQLVTGGDTKNANVPLWETFPWEPDPSTAQQSIDIETQKLDEWANQFIATSQAHSLTPRQRQNQSQQQMLERDIPYLDDLPTLPLLQQIQAASASQVWNRLLLETALASKADRLPTEHWAQLKTHWDTTELTEKEQAFLTAQRTDVTDQVQFLWHSERAIVLAWSLNLIDQLPWADQTSEPAPLLPLIQARLNSPPTHLRPLSEIMDQADQTYRLHWSARNAQYMDRDPPDDLLVDVLLERHHAFAWLLGLPSLEVPPTAPRTPWNQVKPQVSRITEFATPLPASR